MSRTVGQLVSAPIRRGRIGVDPNDRIQFDDEETRARYGPIVNLLAKLHGAHPNNPTGIDGSYSRPRLSDDEIGASLIDEPEVRALAHDTPALAKIIRIRGKLGAVGGKQGAGGSFNIWGGTTSPDGKTLVYDSRPVMTVGVVNALGPESDLTSFIHEFGHFIDSEYDGSIRTGRFAFDHALANGEPEAMALARAASNDSPHFRRSFDILSQTAGPEYVQYWMDANEVWARLYAQWAAWKLRDDYPALWGQFLREMKPKLIPQESWPMDEFEQLIPLIEDFLRVRGLLT